MPKLERTLRHFAKDFGETSAQAVIRWSISTCRNLAKETQAIPEKGENPREMQLGAIRKDAFNVLLVAETATKTARGWKCRNRAGTFYASDRKFLNSKGEVKAWIELHRTRRRARTAKLPPAERKVCTREVFEDAVKDKMRMAGMAKGAWLGAGQDIARSQTGMDKLNIGKGFFGYAQTSGSRFGKGKPPVDGFKPEALITNKVSHISSRDVIKRSAYDKATGWGLKNTISWYRRAINALDKKR